MKKSKIINYLTASLLGSLLLIGCTKEPVDVTSEIVNANKAFMEAFDNGDAHALTMNYTKNAKLYPTNSDVIEGQEAIEGFWNTVMNMGIKKALLETVTAEKFGTIAIEEGRYKLFVEGDQIVDQGKYIVTWKKEDGQWKLQRDIWNTSNPAPQPRASLNDTVWIALNYVKANKVSQFKDFNFKYLGPAVRKHYPSMLNTARFLIPLTQNEDGTYTYIYLMDPAIDPDGYEMGLPLTAEYGEGKAKEYLKMYTDCLKDGKQEFIATVQTEW